MPYAHMHVTTINEKIEAMNLKDNGGGAYGGFGGRKGRKK